MYKPNLGSRPTIVRTQIANLAAADADPTATPPATSGAELMAIRGWSKTAFYWTAPAPGAGILDLELWQVHNSIYTLVDSVTGVPNNLQVKMNHPDAGVFFLRVSAVASGPIADVNLYSLGADL